MSADPKENEQVVSPGTAARLATLPPVAPAGAWIVEPAGGVPAADIQRGDWIADKGRWREVKVCTSTNRMVELITDPTTDLPAIPDTQRVHVARPISCVAVAAAQMLGYTKSPDDRRSKL